ncbi:MAG: DegQ family serine endoprotease [Deltaproteobacteria bacterium]|nr:DegQ family serine endoprotease [Deltaproteobacteria bacterium]
MRKQYSKSTLIVTAFFSALLALLFACSFDFTKKTKAEDQKALNATPAPNSFSQKNSSNNFPSFTEMVKRIKPAVVNISSTHIVRQRIPRNYRNPAFDDFFNKFFGAPQEQSQSSLGSGFIIDAEGTILTNNHVVQDADEIQVKLDDGRKFQAKILGTDPKTDIAVIKMQGASHFPFVPLGNSDPLEVGEWVVAVGNPFGLGQTVTAGIVSAKGRVIGAGPYDNFIQTDASINPGNSGGPLFNLNGEVIGINTAIIASGQGIGFAIPINVAKNLAPQLEKKGKVSRGFLGVGIQEMDENLVKSFGLSNDKGALVVGVNPGGPAEKVGIEVGDVIVSFNGKTIEGAHDLPIQVSQASVGSKVPVEIIRKGQKKNFMVEITELEPAEKQMAQSEKASGTLGLQVREPKIDELEELGLRSKKGVLVARVGQDSAAQWVGLQGGDVILEINSNPINSLEDYNQTVSKIKNGDIVRMLVKRGQRSSYLAFRK